MAFRISRVLLYVAPFLLSSVLGYVLGSFPTGYLVGQFHGIDIREHGSKNTGATNVVRVLGKKAGYFVFFCDAFKGLIAVLLGRLLVKYELWRPISAVFSVGAFLNDTRSDVPAEAASMVALGGIVAALACILGHNFPVWLRFKGGKGVATTVGVLLGLMPLAIGVSAVV